MSEYYKIIDLESYEPIKILIHSVSELEIHWHELIEIIVVLKGSIDLTIEDKHYILRENDLVFINSQEKHNTCGRTEENTILILQISPEHLSIYAPGFRDMRFNCNSVNSTAKDMEKYDVIRHHLGKIVWEMNKKNKGYNFLVGNELNSLVYYLLNNFEHFLIGEKGRKIIDNDVARLDRILTYINDNLERKVTLTHIAKMEHINSYYLSHLFKDKVGFSFQEYINIKRVEKAKTRLLNSNKRITDISNECGFSSTNYFNKVFKEQVGTTPSQFRNGKVKFTTKDSITGVTREQSKTSFDIDRQEAFTKIYSYIRPFDRHTEGSLSSGLHKEIIIDPRNSVGVSYTPYWKKLINFGRASDGIREDVRGQLRQLQKEIKFEHIRFHGIFFDDMKVYNVSNDGYVSYNWTYVDELFDFFKEVDIKPFVELRFVPSELARSDKTTKDLKANIDLVKHMKLWIDLLKEFIRHCINRYGIEEVTTWYFEVGAEVEFESIFLAGTGGDFFEFFKEIFLGIKSISEELLVGGPGLTHGKILNTTWLEDFSQYCNNNNMDLDFVSIHICPEYIPQEDSNHTLNMINEVNKKIDNNMDYKPEFHITEWNAYSYSDNYIHDTSYVATYIIKNVLECLGTVDSLGYLTLADIFEEKKLGVSHFHGGFGLFNKDGLKKASYYAYYLLNKLGKEIIDKGDDYIVTKDGNGIQILAYNYVYFDDLFLSGDTSALTHTNRYNIYENKSEKNFEFNIKGINGKYKVTRYSLNRESGSVYDEWVKMGAPKNMSNEEICYLDGVSRPSIKTGNIVVEKDYNITLKVPIHGAELVSFEGII